MRRFGWAKTAAETVFIVAIAIYRGEVTSSSCSGQELIRMLLFLILVRRSLIPASQCPGLESLLLYSPSGCQKAVPRSIADLVPGDGARRVPLRFTSGSSSINIQQCDATRAAAALTRRRVASPSCTAGPALPPAGKFKYLPSLRMSLIHLSLLE